MKIFLKFPLHIKTGIEYYILLNTEHKHRSSVTKGLVIGITHYPISKNKRIFLCIQRLLLFESFSLRVIKILAFNKIIQEFIFEKVKT